MSRFEELVQKFKEHGHKMTPQRRAILKVLTGSTHHPTAEQIHGLVREQMPDISLATVYNTLHDLIEMEELVELDVGNRVRRYDIARGNHAHQVCRKCGRIEDVSGDFEKLKSLFRHTEGSVPVDYTLIIYGYCKLCVIV